jgi:hypothetical protein
MRNSIQILLVILTAMLLNSCATVNIPKYYAQNKGILDSIDKTYKIENKQRKFSIQFPDKSFNNVSIEIYTDTIKYVYDFGLSEPRLKDTLIRYQMNVTQIERLIETMRSIKCTWVNTLDYYVNGKKNQLVYISIKEQHGRFPFARKKYYILTYYSQPQYYDSEGILLDRKKRKRIRKINEGTFRRINDKVAYTVSANYR